MTMPRFTHLTPSTLDEALNLLKEKGGKANIVAGGSDLMVHLKQRTATPDYVVNIKGLPVLNGISSGPGDTVAIGSLTTLDALCRSEIISKHFPILAEAAGKVASVQIRNVATLGGNLCTGAPSADTATTLLVLGAQVKLRNLKGERTIPLEGFFKGPGETVLEQGEILTGVVIPAPLPHTGSAYWKHQRRQALDLPMVGVSVLLSLSTNRISCTDLRRERAPVSTILQALEKDDVICREVRIALGVAAPTPMRAFSAERLLRGQKLSDSLLDQAAQAASDEAQPRDSIRGEAWYRRDMIKVFVKRMAVMCIERIALPAG